MGLVGGHRRFTTATVYLSWVPATLPLIFEAVCIDGGPQPFPVLIQIHEAAIYKAREPRHLLESHIIGDTYPGVSPGAMINQADGSNVLP